MRQEDEAPLCLRELDDFQRGAMGSWGISGSRAGIALIDIGDVDIVTGHSVHGPREPLDLTAILGTGRRHMQREQVQRIDRNVQFGSLFALVVIARTFNALGRETQCPAVDNDGAGFDGAPCSQRCVCWYTAAQGGRSFGIQRHGPPVFAIWRRPLNTSRKLGSRCPASSRLSVRYGAISDHSSSDTSDG